MTSTIKSYVHKFGLPLEQINPGSTEYAIEYKYIENFLQLLEQANVPILGGDVLIMVNDKLKYLIHELGYEYFFLNWSCSQNEGEDNNSYINRSIKYARNKISEGHTISQELNRDFYFVIVF